MLTAAKTLLECVQVARNAMLDLETEVNDFDLAMSMRGMSLIVRM